MFGLIKTVAVVLRNMILGSNIISLSLIANPRKMFDYISESLFLYKAFNFRRGLPEKNVFDVLKTEDIENVTLGNLKSDGLTWFFNVSSFASDLMNLCLICRIIQPRVVFEIGTMRGYLTFHFALNTPDDAKIYTLDLPRDEKLDPKLKTTLIDEAHVMTYKNSEEYHFVNNNVASKITCLFGDSATFDYSPYYGKVDFFYIDGAHSYEYVRSDTLNALKCAQPGSVIAWHDFGRVGVNGVTKWLLELSKDNNIYSVPGGSLAFMVVK